MSDPAPRGPTPLASKIASLIAASGPISVSEFMTLCLADPQFGYYRTREPFGVSGDFITAPEVTQLFGEMIGIFIVHCWQVAGEPPSPRLVEFGPGRGTLMKDMLRVIRRLAPRLFETMTVHLVETSPRLAAIQAETLAESGVQPKWHGRIEDVPPGHLLLVANELFDALPVRQFIMADGKFRERVVQLSPSGELAFGIGPGRIDPTSLPDDAAAQPEGTIFERAPAREAVMQVIAERLVAGGGTALAIDYGHFVTGYGDTLQALWQGRPDDPLAHPGEADLTSHVDFASLAATVKAAGAHVAGLAYQGDFLLGLGLLERAGRLGSGKSAAEQAAIRTAVERIAGEGEGRMGELFKVLAVTGSPLRLQPFAPPPAPA
jgi:SAM-dependent MidA family methyltransferase